MDTFPGEITERTCRFCLKQTARITPLFDRFEPEEVGEHLQALLGLQVSPDDKHLNVCRKCERQLKLLFSIMVEFRRANELFCALLKKHSITQELEIVVDDKALIAVTEPESRSDDVEFLVDQQSVDFSDVEESPIKKEKIETIDFETDFQLHDNDAQPTNFQLHDNDATPTIGEKADPLRTKIRERYCYICQSFAGTGYLFVKHLTTVHGDLISFRCSTCLMVLSTPRDVNDHLRSHQTPHGCLYCDEMFASTNELDAHRTHCNGYRCEGCGQQFPFVGQLREHGCNGTAKHQQSMQLVNDFIDGIEVSRPLQCGLCSMEYNQSSKLAQHIEKEHPVASVTLHQCNICPRKFTSIGATRHHRAFHKTNTVTSGSTKPAALDDPNDCVICLKSFKLDRELLQHLEADHADVSVKLYQCTKCDRKFTTEAKLQKHDYNTHQGRQPQFFCSFCGRLFTKRIGLRDHESTHRGVLRYQCEECNREFSYKSSYDRHMQVVHSDAKQFTCHFCQKCFKRKATLKVHLRLHTGEKPYQCEICSCRFVDPSSFHRHKQKEHGPST